MNLLVLAVTLSANVLTLDDAVRIALESHPEVTVARSQVEAAEARARETRAGTLPSVDSSASYDVSAGRPPPGPFDVGGGYRASVSGSVLLYDFGRTRARVRSSEVSADAVKTDAEAMLRDIVFNVRLAYIDVLEAEAMVQVNEQTLENERRHLRRTEAFVEAGERPRIDLVRFQTRVEEARAALVMAKSDLQTSRARLLRVIGLPGEPTAFAVEEPELPNLEVEALTSEELLELAFEERADLEAARLSLVAGELGVEATRLRLRPSVRVSAGTSYYGDRFTEPGAGASLGVSLSWPLFDGFAASSALEAEQAGLRAERARLLAREHEVWGEITEVRSQLDSNLARLEAAEQGLTSALELLRLAEARYAEGVGDSLELASAQLDVTSASARRVRAAYDLATARARLLRALGRQVWS